MQPGLKKVFSFSSKPFQKKKKTTRKKGNETKRKITHAIQDNQQHCKHISFLVFFPFFFSTVKPCQECKSVFQPVSFISFHLFRLQIFFKRSFPSSYIRSLKQSDFMLKKKIIIFWKV